MTTSRQGATSVRDCFCKCFVCVLTLKHIRIRLGVTHEAENKGLPNKPPPQCYKSIISFVIWS